MAVDLGMSGFDDVVIGELPSAKSSVAPAAAAVSPAGLGGGGSGGNVAAERSEAALGGERSAVAAASERLQVRACGKCVGARFEGLRRRASGCIWAAYGLAWG
eukprot:132910-Chlamydomonas_euryale.AAC.1